MFLFLCEATDGEAGVSWPSPVDNAKRHAISRLVMFRSGDSSRRVNKQNPKPRIKASAGGEQALDKLQDEARQPWDWATTCTYVFL